MKWSDVREIPLRTWLLITRRFTWEDEETGEVSTHKESLRVAWLLVGPQSFTWWWVLKYGTLPCSCIRNPLTRRMVMYAGNCPEHGLTRGRIA